VEIFQIFIPLIDEQKLPHAVLFEIMGDAKEGSEGKEYLRGGDSDLEFDDPRLLDVRRCVVEVVTVEDDADRKCESRYKEEYT